MFVEEGRDGEPVVERVATWPASGDPVTAQMGLLWAGLISENAGDIAKLPRRTPARGSPTRR